MIAFRLASIEQHSAPAAVSVVVPVKNRPADIARCLDSLLRSNYPTDRLELICVDNGSTDNTPAVLEGYRPRVRVVTQRIPGPAAARNAGIAVAAGEIVAFTDSDCIVEPAWVSRITAPLSDPGIGIVGGRIRAQTPCSKVGLFGEIIHDHRRAIGESDPPYTISMNIAARTEMLRELGGFDERLLRCEDVDLSVRAIQAGLRLAYCDDAVIYHRNRDTVYELMREGFQHGYYAPLLVDLHHSYYRRSKEKYRNAPRRPQVERAEPQISRWRRALYSKLFNASKRTGYAIGRRIARPRPQPCTTSGI